MVSNIIIIQKYKIQHTKYKIQNINIQNNIIKKYD